MLPQPRDPGTTVIAVDHELETVDGHVRPTPRGRRFLNRLLGGLLDESGS